MTSNYINETFYNCGSEGICTSNPRTAALQEVLLLYLKHAAYYTLELINNGVQNTKIKNLILNTISLTITNFEFSENDFKCIMASFYTELPAIIKEYERVCSEKNITPKYLKPSLKQCKKENITQLIRIGEKEFLKNQKNISENIRNLYKILFFIAKSLCVNIQDLQTFGIDAGNGYMAILKLLNSMNKNKSTADIKKLAFEFSSVNKLLDDKLRKAQEDCYGKQRPTNVSYSTTPSKSILVAGSNIKELEDILKSVQNTEICIYTHDRMILAHTFPEFSKYKNLKGHYGQSSESYLSDFATFPGPIILTKHSLHNVENLYRGRLYTTDLASSKGIIQIKDNDFADVIESAKNSKGFKTGKKCNDEFVGYNFDDIAEKIEEKLQNKEYKTVAIIENNIGEENSSEYFDILFNKTINDILYISLAPRYEKENLISFNACFDNYAILKISDFIKSKTKLPLTIFFPDCKSNIVSSIIYLKHTFNAEIFVGKCNPIELSPSLINALFEMFGINKISNVNDDLKKVLQ